ncbi:MAG: DUF58 domain-containing protein, partial [Actinomycetota bacterium]
MLFSRSVLSLALALALIIIGKNSRSGWLFWLAGMLLSALVTSWLLSLRQVRGLSVKRRHKPRASEGEDLEVSLEVHNNSRLSRNLLEVIDSDPCDGGSQKRPRLRTARKSLRHPGEPRGRRGEEEGGGKASFLIPYLGPGSDASITYKRGGLTRGIYEGWPGFFYSEGLLGLARHSNRFECPSRLVIFPRYSEIGSFPLVDSFLHPQRLPSYHLAKGVVGTDYYGVREFQPGDPLRHVHWKTTARR